MPRPGLCTDNGAMIGAAGARRYAAGERAGLDLEMPGTDGNVGRLGVRRADVALEIARDGVEAREVGERLHEGSAHSADDDGATLVTIFNLPPLGMASAALTATGGRPLAAGTVVLACARSPHEAVRARAVVALGAFPVAEAMEALGEFVANGAAPHGTAPATGPPPPRPSTDTTPAEPHDTAPDLARAALIEKQKAEDMSVELRTEIEVLDDALRASEADIAKLQGKLREARTRQNSIDPSSL